MSGSLLSKLIRNTLSMYLNKTNCQTSEIGIAMTHPVCDYLSFSKPLRAQLFSQLPQWH